MAGIQRDQFRGFNAVLADGTAEKVLVRTQPLVDACPAESVVGLPVKMPTAGNHWVCGGVHADVALVRRVLRSSL